MVAGISVIEGELAHRGRLGVAVGEKLHAGGVIQQVADVPLPGATGGQREIGRRIIPVEGNHLAIHDERNSARADIEIDGVGKEADLLVGVNPDLTLVVFLLDPPNTHPPQCH